MAYHWMPSGVDSNYLPLNVWVRPIANTRQHVPFDHVGKILHLQHADLMFDSALGAKMKAMLRRRDGFRLQTFGPYGEWVMDSAGRSGLTVSAGNYANAAGIKMCCDSGGFSLKVPKKGGTWLDFLDPNTVIKKYNACADVGMALDAPPRLGVNPSIGLEISPTVLSILARMQRANSRVLIDEKRNDLGLINILHGISADDFRRWISIVDIPGQFVGWAVSCDVDGADPVTGLKQASIYRAAAILYHEYGMREGWLHLFKVSGQWEIPVAAWLGRYFGKVSSDSTSWTFGGYQQYKFLDQGRLRTLSARSLGLAEGLLSVYCRCEVCELMRTFDSIKNTAQARSKAYRAINLHNIIVIMEAVEYWNELALRMGFDDYLRVVMEQFGNKGQLLDKLRYVECAMQQGPDRADAQFCLRSSKHLLMAA